MNRKKQAWKIAQSALLTRFGEIEDRQREGKNELTDEQWEEVQAEMNKILTVLREGEENA